MNLSFNEIEQLRTGITVYSSKFTEDQLKEQKLEGLLSFLKESTGKEVVKEDFNKIYYHEFHKELNFSRTMMDYNPVSTLSRYVEEENKSLDRIGKLIGKSVSEMTLDELTDTSMKLFTFTSEDYTVLAEKQGINLKEDEEFDSVCESLILPGLLQAKGVNFTRAEIRQKILDRNNSELGYFINDFKDAFEYSSEEGSFNEGLIGLYSTFHDEFSKQKNNLEKHLIADKQLTEKHTILAPQLLSDKTMHLDIIPYAIDFTLDGKLVVLGGKDTKEEDFESTQMLLNLYDINTSKLLKSVNTKIQSRFDGALGMAWGFQGSLSVGQDGIIYVNGDSKRYSSNLELLKGNESNFIDAIQLLEDEEILSGDKEIFQVAQSDGILYFALQGADNPKCYDNTIVATNGKKIIGEPLLGYSPNDGSGSSAWDSNPRIVVFEDNVYFKASKSILSVDKSFTRNALENVLFIVGREEYSSVIPSKHCVSPSGILYVVNQFPEESAQSIQGFIRGEEKGEFATHVYPQDYPGGSAAFRSMAISKDNILAYSSLDGNKVHFYKLEK